MERKKLYWLKKKTLSPFRLRLDMTLGDICGFVWKLKKQNSFDTNCDLNFERKKFSSRVHYNYNFTFSKTLKVTLVSG